MQFSYDLPINRARLDLAPEDGGVEWVEVLANNGRGFNPELPELVAELKLTNAFEAFKVKDVKEFENRSVRITLELVKRSETPLGPFILIPQDAVLDTSYQIGGYPGFDGKQFIGLETEFDESIKEQLHESIKAAVQVDKEQFDELKVNPGEVAFKISFILL